MIQNIISRGVAEIVFAKTNLVKKRYRNEY